MAHIIPDNYIERRDARLDDLMHFAGFADAVLCATVSPATTLEAIRSSLKLAYESGYIHALRDEAKTLKQHMGELAEVSK